MSRLSATTLTGLSLVGLTLATMAAGTPDQATTAGGIAVMVIAAAKALAILYNFLELKQASRGWRTLLTLYVFLLCGGVLAAYGVALHLHG